MESMSFSGSQPPQPYPLSMRIRWMAGRIIKWALRTAILVFAMAAIVWTGAFIAGCSGLKTALKSVSADPTLAYTAPGDWDKPAEGENAAPYFASSFALMSYSFPLQAGAIRKVIAKGWESLAEEQREELRKWLKSQELAFDLAAKGADRPTCKYSREWWADQAKTVEMEPWRISIPELEGVEQMCEALVALAQSRAADGKFEEAREAIRVAVGVAESLRDDPFLQSQRCRVSQVSLILENVTELVPRSATRESLEAWLKIIPASNAFDGCLERAGKWLLKERVDLFQGSADRYWFWQRIYYRWGPMDFSKMLRKRLADPLFERDAIKCLEDTERLVEIWRKPYLEAKAEAAALEKEWAEWKESSHPTAPLVWHVCPSLRLERMQMARARCAMVRTGLEWELAKLKTESYPEKCEAIDPLTGTSFRLEEGPARLTGANVAGRAYASKKLANGRVTSTPKLEPNTWVLRK